MLDLNLPRSKVAEVRNSLAQLAAEAPERLALLFDPQRPSAAAPLPAPLAEPLVRMGLMVEAEGGYQTEHRLRSRGSRHYLMTTGNAEYRQDIWPETDSLLEILESAPPGRLLDMGTGTGIVAVEGAARGHRVVATDLYENTLKLARFNAGLNDIEGIDFRQGHLFEPARGEKFDLILSAPHYTRAADQLRLEALRSGLSLVAEGGRLVIATFLEWEGGDDAPLPVVETILRPMVARGASVTVRPIVSPLKKNWFTRVESETPLRGLVSRHRFLVIIEPSGGRLSLERPRLREQLTEVFVPLSRLKLGADRGEAPRGRAVVDQPADVAKLEDLLVGLASGLVTLSGGIPRALHDSCRFGGGPCVSMDDAAGSAGAILDLSGNVRPCTSGGVVARVDDSLATLLQRQRRLFTEVGLRRGCDTCEARPWCPRCLYPGPMSERHYCAILRSAGPELRLLHRLLGLLATLDARMRRLQIKLRRTPSLLAARGRPMAAAGAHFSDAALAAVAARLQHHECWILLMDESRFALVMRHDGTDWIEQVERPTAAIAELLLDGAGARDLEQHASDEQLGAQQLWEIVERLGGS